MDFHFYIIRILFLTSLSFVVALAWTPLLIRLLVKYKMGKQIRDNASAPIFSELHKKKSGTPTMGGILIWVTVLAITLFFSYVAGWTNMEVLDRLNFLSRSEVLLPLGVLVASGLAGMVDDYLNIRRIGPKGGGLSMRHRLMLYTAIAAVGAWWFFYKLDWYVLQIPLHIPFFGDVQIGWWYIPFFIFIIVATSFSVNEIDGLDGLAGGSVLCAFAAYGAIAFALGKYDLATFCGVIVGSLLAFLWYNITPAKFFMGDTGAMSLGVTLGIMAMLTNYAFLLPVIGLMLVVESLSVIIQLVSKKFFKRKVFLSAPIHHHFEALGWPEAKIVMRFWVISAVSACVGLMLFLLDKGF